MQNNPLAAKPILPEEKTLGKIAYDEFCSFLAEPLTHTQDELIEGTDWEKLAQAVATEAIRRHDKGKDELIKTLESNELDFQAHLIANDELLEKLVNKLTVVQSQMRLNCLQYGLSEIADLLHAYHQQKGS